MFKLGNYVIRICAYSGNFNLFRLYNYQKKGKDGVVEKDMAYGVTLDRCIYLITQKELESGEFASLSQYTAAFAQTMEKYMQELRSIAKTLKNK